MLQCLIIGAEKGEVGQVRKAPMGMSPMEIESHIRGLAEAGNYEVKEEKDSKR